MNVTLTPHLKEMVERKVASGLYADVSEVVREALRLMEAKDAGERLRAEVERGFASIARGDTIAYTRETMERLKAEAEEEERRGAPISDVVVP